MTSYFIAFMCALALAVMGCSETSGTGGSGGDGGNGGTTGQRFPCTEQGIRNAIAEGGGPHRFDCDGSMAVVTDAEIVIDNDVILDGEHNLTVDGNRNHLVFEVPSGVAVGLRSLTLTRGSSEAVGAIWSQGTVSLTSVTVSDNACDGKGCAVGGIVNIEGGTMALTRSTVSGNGGGGILNGGDLTLTNSTVSGNGLGIVQQSTGILALVNTTVSETHTIIGVGTSTTLANSVIVGECGAAKTSNGHNIESPGDTCGFDEETDQVNVSADDLALGPLQKNGGPTETHALGEGSVAIDVIPPENCVDPDGQPLATDQRGEPRDSMCDVGAFERSARDAALATYCAAVLECFPDDESCEADFVNFLWVGSGGDFAACTSAKVELVECVASLDCDKLGEAREDYDVVFEECTAQAEAAWQTCELIAKELAHALRN